MSTVDQVFLKVATPAPHTDVKETQCLLSPSEQVVMDGDGGDDGGGDVGDGGDDGDYILREPLAV